MTRKSRLTRIAIVAIAIVGAVGALLYWQLGPREAAARQPPYTVATITRGDIVQAINTTGQLAPATSVEVSSQISGLVTEVNVDFNSLVKKGQVLARIDPSTFEQRLRQTEADLQATKASHHLVELEVQRLKDLRAQELVTQQEYDQVEARLQQSEASLITRQAAVENARVDLERCTITSPIDGIVIYRQVEVGKTVVSSMSAPTLFVIAQNLAKMRIIAPVSEVDIWSVKPGLPVTFTVDALPGRTFNGMLTQIRNPYTPSDRQQNQQNQQSAIASFDAVIDVDNTDLMLRPSLTANVAIISARSEGALRLPNGALRVNLPEDLHEAAAMSAEVMRGGPAPMRALRGRGGRGGGAMQRGPRPIEATPRSEGVTRAKVYRLPGGSREAEPEEVRVEIGVSDGIMTEVLEGLDEGDVVVTGVARSMAPGRMLF